MPQAELSQKADLALSDLSELADKVEIINATHKI